MAKIVLNKQKKREAYAYYWSVAKRYPWHLLFVIGLIIVTLLLQMIEPYLYKKIINVIEEKSLHQFGEAISLILKFSMAWLVVALVGFIFNFLRQRFTWKYSRVLYDDFFVEAVNKIFNLDIGFHADRNSGETSKILDDYSEGTWQISEQSLNNIVFAIINFVISMVVVFALDYRMAIISMSAFPLYIFSTFYVHRKTEKMQIKVNKIWTKAWGVMTESISNIVSIKSFAQEPHFSKKVNNAQVNANWIQDRISIYWALTWQAQGFSALISRLAVIGGGAYFVQKGSLTIGDIAMFLGYLSFLYAPIQSIAAGIATLHKFNRWYLRGYKLITQKIEVVSGGLKPKHPQGHIVFKNVSFRYTTKNNKLGYAVRNVSFEIKPGETVALVGLSGSGKTTITQLIQRFYDPTDGSISFDGHNLREYNIRGLRQAIGIVFQENVLFHDTVEMNIKLGKMNASREEVIESAKKAAIHDFIMNLKDGYETKVGERGIKLSGGQRQRIAIARAIIKNPALIIFDEATSALDSKTEREVHEAIKNLTRDKSTLIIAHRLSTIVHADKIIMLDKGSIIDIGNHQELLKKCRPYKELVDIQTQSMLMK